MGCVYRAVAVPSLEPPYDCIHFRVRPHVEKQHASKLGKADVNAARLRFCTRRSVLRAALRL
jgi:hypothetical protein